MGERFSEKLASETCQDVSRRIEKAVDRMEAQNDRVSRTEVTLATLSALVTEHAARDQERWEQSRKEHDSLWQAIRDDSLSESQKHERMWRAIEETNNNVVKLMSKDKMIGTFTSASIVLAAGGISGLAVWLLGN